MKKSGVSTNEEISFPQMKKPQSQIKKNKIKDSTNEEIVIRYEGMLEMTPNLVCMTSVVC